MLEALNSSQSIELNELYQEVIIEHSRRPRYKSGGGNCRFCQAGKNPLCGDAITVYCQVVEEKSDCPAKLFIHFNGVGCSISQASASMMCESLQGVTLAEACHLISQAESIYTGKTKVSLDELNQDIEALYGVSKFPVRVKCAALPWKTLEILLTEHFDKDGMPKVSCDETANCSLQPRKLKIVTTEV